MARLKITSDGLDLEKAFRELGGQVEGYMHEALYDGAAVVLKAVDAAIDEIPEEEGYIPPGRQRASAKAAEKEALHKGLGIARHRAGRNGIETAISFDGYADALKTKKYPQGLPIPLLARSIESGSTVRKRCSFVRKAEKAAEAEAIRVMEEKLSELIDNAMR